MSSIEEIRSKLHTAYFTCGACDGSEQAIAGLLAELDRLTAELAEAKRTGTALAQLDDRKLTNRAVNELRHQVQYMRDAVLDIFHALNPKAGRKPNRDVMKAAATVRGQTAYINDVLRDAEERVASIAAERDAAIRERDARPNISRADAALVQIRSARRGAMPDEAHAVLRVGNALRAHAAGADAPRVDAGCEECCGSGVRHWRDGDAPCFVCTGRTEAAKGE